MTNALLKSVFGHDGFRPGQEELIDAMQTAAIFWGSWPREAGSRCATSSLRSRARNDAWWCLR